MTKRDLGFVLLGLLSAPAGMTLNRSGFWEWLL